MKEDFKLNVVIILFAIGVALNTTIMMVIVSKVDTIVDAIQKDDLVEVYTWRNIYYLRGAHISDESGLYDLNFNTRIEALNWLSKQTADDTRMSPEMIRYFCEIAEFQQAQEEFTYQQEAYGND